MQLYATTKGHHALYVVPHSLLHEGGYVNPYHEHVSDVA